MLCLPQNQQKHGGVGSVGQALCYVLKIDNRTSGTAVLYRTKVRRTARVKVHNGSTVWPRVSGISRVRTVLKSYRAILRSVPYRPTVLAVLRYGGTVEGVSMVRRAVRMPILSMRSVWFSTYQGHGGPLKAQVCLVLHRKPYPDKSKFARLRKSFFPLKALQNVCVPARDRR